MVKAVADLRDRFRDTFSDWYGMLTAVCEALAFSVECELTCLCADERNSVGIEK